MGNIFQKEKPISLPCQACGDFFMRRVQGPVLCENCKNKEIFEKLLPEVKYEVVVPLLLFPMYTFIKNKTSFVKFQTAWNSDVKELMEQIKPFRNCHPEFRKKYKMIKVLLYYLHSINYFQGFKGIMIHSSTTEDLLFVYDSNIQDKDRIIHLDISELYKKLLFLSN